MLQSLHIIKYGTEITCRRVLKMNLCIKFRKISLLICDFTQKNNKEIEFKTGQNFACKTGFLAETVT